MCRGVSEIVYDNDTFGLFENFENVDGITVIRLFRGLKVLELLEKQIKNFLLLDSNLAVSLCTLS